jgi:DNA-binding NarL/FixJ family response regulator
MSLPILYRQVAIRVVLAEDNLLVREGVRQLIESVVGIELVGVCGDLDSLLAMVEAAQPDVVLTDIRMPPTGTDEGIQAAEKLRQSAPGTDVDQLVNAIREAARGGSVIDPKVVEELISARSRKAHLPLGELTPREHDVLAQVAQGKNNAAVAKALFSSSCRSR